MNYVSFNIREDLLPYYQFTKMATDKIKTIIHFIFKKWIDGGCQQENLIIYYDGRWELS